MVNEKYARWLQNATGDKDIVEELKSIDNDHDAINDRFYKDLEFGTGGLRGVIGAGTNRMNIYTVGHATQGLANYVNSVNKTGSVAIAYDSRIKSDVFARQAASVLAANGIKVHLYNELMPTPMLSFAVRRLKCDAGIVITASHNPSKYNGYKAYGPDGCQLTLDASEYVLSMINSIDIFSGVKTVDFDSAVAEGKIEFIEQWLIDEYLENVKKQSVCDENYDFGDLKVIYTPLHGTGNKPVRAILNKIGVKNVTVVPEQELPNGNFPTAPFPNPEFRQTFECALKMAETLKPDLLLATDPDCDRVGIAVNNGDDFTLLSGNEVGVLLLNYLLKRRTELGTLPQNPIAVKTIVSTDLSYPVASEYGCQLIDVLTGFKFIGEQILLLEKKNEENRFVFGYEESYGYLAGSYVRDKDAVVASMLICEMVCYYKSKGQTLIEVLEGLYQKHGYYYNTQKSFTCEGQSGMMQMESSMANLRSNPPKEIAGLKVVSLSDYETSKNLNLLTNQEQDILLPKSNVLSYLLENKSTVIIRPSGTEPKIKVYLSAVGATLDDAINSAKLIEATLNDLLGL